MDVANILTAIIAICLVLCIFIPLLIMIGDALFGKPDQEQNRDHRTITGETFNERAAYHRRGELSPGEHAMARMIREHLQRNEE